MAYHKAKKDRKEEVIRLRVTTEQELMTEAARKLGLDISAWLRTMGVQEAKRIEYQERARIPEAVELSKRIAERRTRPAAASESRRRERP